MDPIMTYKLGLLRQQEFLEWAAKRQSGNPVRWYFSEAGILLQRLGRKLEKAAQPASRAENSVRTTNVENCFENA